MRTPARAFRPEVQALRALAVLLVVVCHLWAADVPGGYVGVDVFFVISGFLITSHLHQEVIRRGSISLVAFYTRRARRLLPAALLVLVVTAVLAFVFLPVSRWGSTAADVLGSTFYVQNWQLALRAVDYSNAGQAASIVQHYWSLSVEEQFYLAWPPLILLLLALGRRLPNAHRDRLLLGGIASITVVSFAFSVYETGADPSRAYFITPTRIWELGVGAVLALWTASRRETRSRHRRPALTTGMVVLRWVGMSAIVGAAGLLAAKSPVPGYLAAVPVLGTAAVIAAGDAGSWDPLAALMRRSPVQFLGDVSYALYLWHWPVLVIAPFALGHALGSGDKVLLVAGCVVLAWLTRVGVERPTQRSGRLARPRVMAAFTAAAMLVVSMAAGLLWLELQSRRDVAQARVAEAQADPCFGAAAMAAGSADCADRFSSPASLTPAPGDEPWFIDPACTVTAAPIRVVDCKYGDGPVTAKVALVGDSHAEHWRGALHRLAEAHHWEIVEMLRGGCPVTSARVLSLDRGGIDTEACSAWGEEVDTRLTAEDPDAIFTSSWAGAYVFDTADSETSLERGSDAFADTWTNWARTGAKVFVLRDVPTTGGRDIPECLATHVRAPVACASARRVAVAPDAATVAASRVASRHIREIDLTDYFCDHATCYAAIGNAMVYFDYNHMSAQFSRSLAPYLLQAVGDDLP